MRTFDIPNYYKSSFISTIKNSRKDNDPRKKDFSPTLLDFGPVQFIIARCTFYSDNGIKIIKRKNFK